jgi:hypothetical protein
LIEDLRLQVKVRTDSATTRADATDSEADGPVMAAAFEDLLLGIDRLRRVSERIETLEDKHPGMENGLVSVAGNIRSIATVWTFSRSPEARLAARRKTHQSHTRMAI